MQMNALPPAKFQNNAQGYKIWIDAIQKYQNQNQRNSKMKVMQFQDKNIQFIPIPSTKCQNNAFHCFSLFPPAIPLLCTFPQCNSILLRLYHMQFHCFKCSHTAIPLFSMFSLRNSIVFNVSMLQFHGLQWFHTAIPLFTHHPHCNSVV